VGAVFVDFFHFLLLFLPGVSFVNYFLLLKGVRFVTFCYFFLLLVTLINYFLLLRRARVYIVFIVRRGKGCSLILFLFFLLLSGKGVEVNVFFFHRYMKRWKEEGERGTFFRVKCFFHCGEAREGKGVYFCTNSLWGEGSVESSHSWGHSWV
jgi:hypothetical protein